MKVKKQTRFGGETTIDRTGSNRSNSSRIIHSNYNSTRRGSKTRRQRKQKNRISSAVSIIIIIVVPGVLHKAVVVLTQARAPSPISVCHVQNVDEKPLSSTYIGSLSLMVHELSNVALPGTDGISFIFSPGVESTLESSPYCL